MSYAFILLNTRQKEASSVQNAMLVTDSAIRPPQLDRLEPCWSVIQVYWPCFLPFSWVVTFSTTLIARWGDRLLSKRHTILWFRIDIVSSSSTRILVPRPISYSIHKYTYIHVRGHSAHVYSQTVNFLCFNSNKSLTDTPSAKTSRFKSAGC